jgi:hypothetical protein
MSNDDRSWKHRSTRRSVVKSGAKLAYATPLVAASFSLLNQTALAADCSCKPADAGFVFDASPPLGVDSNPAGFSPACCSCQHCIYLGAMSPYYNVSAKQCYQDGASIAHICYPLCDDDCGGRPS